MKLTGQAIVEYRKARREAEVTGKLKDQVDRYWPKGSEKYDTESITEELRRRGIHDVANVSWITMAHLAAANPR